MELGNESTGGESDGFHDPEYTVVAPSVQSVQSADHATISTYNPALPSRLEEEGNNSSSFLSIVRAVLVNPPVEAYRVSIDEDNIALRDDLDGKDPAGTEQGGTRRFSTAWCLITSCLIVVLICIVVMVPCAVRFGRTSSSTSDGAPLNSVPPYPCYNSTKDILHAQLSSEEGALSGPYVICPNTWIRVGTVNDPTKNDFTIVDGDYPILVVRSDVTIQCGLDGRRENNCTLDGGFLQVHTSQTIPTLEGGWTLLETPTDNMTIRGITFTGKPFNPVPFGGSSVVLSHPGRGMRFEDCSWTDYSAGDGLISVHHCGYQQFLDLPLEDNSIEVTFSDCTFTNIVYEGPLIRIVAQNVTVERSVFDNITLPSLTTYQYRCSKNEYEFLDQEGVCSGLFYCGREAVCTMRGVCVTNFEHPAETPSVVYVANTSEFYFDDLFLDTAASDECQMSVVDLDTTAGFSNCSDIFSSSVCPIPSYAQPP